MSQLQVAKQVFHFSCGCCPWWWKRTCQSVGSSMYNQRTAYDQECYRSLTVAKVSEKEESDEPKESQEEV